MGRPVVAIALSALMISCARDQSDSVPYFHVLEEGEEYAAVVSDPIQWSADNLADAPSARAPDYHMRTHDIDLDHDGASELLVWSRTRMGMASGPYLAFRRVQGGFRYIGSFCCGIYKVLPLADDGALRLACYSHFVCDEGRIEILTNNGRRFISILRESISMQDGDDSAGTRRFTEAFGDRAYREGELIEFDQTGHSGPARIGGQDDAAGRGERRARSGH